LIAERSAAEYEFGYEATDDQLLRLHNLMKQNHNNSHSLETHRAAAAFVFRAKALFSVLALVLVSLPAGLGAESLERGFHQPPPEARPWVYRFWLNGNISSNGITADLEAMQRVGIGGALIMEVDQGSPVGPVDFMGASWRNLFKHVVGEAPASGLGGQHER
jgi:hypothetical protein